MTEPLPEYCLLWINAWATCAPKADWIQIANAAGTWVAGIGTLAAVIVSLMLARDARRVRLRVHIAIFDMIGNGHRGQFVAFEVVNVADRTVTITHVGWQIGRRKSKRFAYQDVSGAPLLDDVPKRLDHAQRARFGADLERSLWLGSIVDFVGEDALDTMRGTLTTSIGETIETAPAPELLERIQTVIDARKTSRAAGLA